jgi:formamidopyrimidine-DNA glycosylase
MPELPEVRALAERLHDSLVGASLVGVHIYSFSGLKTVAPSPSALVNAPLVGVASYGKYLRFEFGERGHALLHLGNSGRVDVETPIKSTRPRGSVARLEFERAGILVREFGTERRASLWVLDARDEGPLATIGPEPFADAFCEFVRHGNDPRWLHTMLRDQRTVAGVGRGYADDALHRARLSPFTALSRLDHGARNRLLNSVQSVLAEALERERRRAGGLSDASLGDRFTIHRRAASPCPSCGRTLERVSFEANDIVYCPDCQTKGKVLSDRRLSRVVR